MSSGVWHPRRALQFSSRSVPRLAIRRLQFARRRNASTARPSSPSSTPPSEAAMLGPGLRTFLYLGAIAAAGTAAYLYVTDTRATLVHRYIIPPTLRALAPDAEDAHRIAVRGLRTAYNLGLHPRDRGSDGGLSVTVFGRHLSNPIGISAGLDKDAQIPDALFALGAAVVEVGGITPVPQPGNPKPRVFRVVGLEGMVNRYGLNSAGAESVARTLRNRLRTFARRAGRTPDDILADNTTPVGSLSPGRLLCVQVAKAKGTDEHDVDAVAADYAECVRHLAPYADVLVVNVSSPNTPGLRDLQAAGPLARILSTVVAQARATAAAHGRTASPPRVMVKVSPDEDSDSQVEGVVRAVWSSGVDGVIVGNTTKRRDVVPLGAEKSLKGRDLAALAETGGYSGPTMFDRTLALVGKYRRTLDGYSLLGGTSDSAEAKEIELSPAAAPIEEQKVIFSTGGITNGKQALQVLNAGASVAMIYTGMTYGGAGTVTRIKGEMREGLTPL